MNDNQKPHSRDKKVGTGSADVHKGEQVNTGHGPVGGGHGGSSSDGKGQRGILSSMLGGGSSSGSSQGGGQKGGLPIKLNLKTILVLVVAVVVILLLLKMCGGGCDMPDLPDLPDTPDTPGDNSNLGVNTNDTFTNIPPDTTLDTTVSPLARAKYVTPVGGGNDTWTIMVYMCGTDLESKYKMATMDLQEMLNANLSDKVRIIVTTGGCKKWNNNVISSSVNQIWELKDDGLVPVEQSWGTSAMTDPNHLSDFIKYCKTNYPADRNMLIFWDHGGGSVTGYGYDEKNTSASSMTLAKIDSALKNGGVKFDVIGFDACLMATLETGLVCEPYADYLLASEETEPGTGWYYTNWLTKLSQNTSMPTIELGKIIVDDFISSSCSADRNAQVTLSIVDLAEMKGTIPSAFNDFSTSTNEMIKADNYAQIASARAGARQFAKSSKINQVDFIDLANRINTADSKALVNALLGCVKYNRATMSNCYGISIYFPYEDTKSMNSAVASYKAIGIDNEYTKCIQSFASLEVGGQVTAAASQVSPSSLSGGGDILGSLLGSVTGGSSTGSTSPLGLLGSLMGGGSSTSAPAGNGLDVSTIAGLLSGFSGRSMPNGYDWVDTELVAGHAESIAVEFVDPSHIVATEKDGKKVLTLTDAEWALIQTVELNVFVKDGNGYIDLGFDNTFDLNGNDLSLTYDKTWLTIDGHTVAYYLDSDTEGKDGKWVTVGRVPAKLNGELVNLQVVFKEGEDPTITGAYPMYEDVDVESKGLIEVKAGDTIQPLCDYYNEDGSYNASYTLGQSFKISAKPVIENLTLTTTDVQATYRLTDIYGNHFWVGVD